MSDSRNDSRSIAEKMLKTYFTTFDYPLTHHQLNSYDQFVANDIPAIIKYSNPLLLLQEKLGNTDEYKYRVEVFIGGLKGDQFYIGTPSISLKENTEVRVLYPNEARLRNLTYATNIEADIVIKITFTKYVDNKLQSIVVFLDPKEEKYNYLGRIPLCKIPIMLHSRYCILRDKPKDFLQEVGESPYDYGGYFIIDGAEKVLVTQQEAAYNTLCITRQTDVKIELYANIHCLNPQTREVKRIAFSFLRNQNTIEVNLPLVRKGIPLFVLFRALGVNADEDILRLIFPIEDDVETKILAPLLHESLLEAGPFLDQYSAVQYIKVLTKGFSEAHVYDILLNQMFIHVDNKPMNKAVYLAECVRKILRVYAGIDTVTDKDDIRNQRCLTSGFLTRLLFQTVYKSWSKQVIKMIDEEFKFNKTVYSDSDFVNLFLPGNIGTFFQVGKMTEGITRGFKGKWSIGHEVKAGVIQPLSRLSYLDFLSHCRRIVLDFDTGIKLQGPRRLHPTQYGYFCTSETPGGASIGITKNFSILTAISLSMEPAPFISWLFKTMKILYVNDLTPLMFKIAVPVFVNGGVVGYSLKPKELIEVTKLLKHTGCLPAYSSISFNIRERRVSFYFDEGRPVRPLIYINKVYPDEKLERAKSWRQLVLGTFERNNDIELSSSIFRDPLDGVDNVTAEKYIALLLPFVGCVEYVDPYESNEAFIAMYKEYAKKESTHVEIHPSTMLGLLTSMIPFPNHNQSPRNQLSCSQSKQGISIPFTNYKNRFDNQTHILCYGEAPLVRSLYYDYVADGKIGYGHNLVLAMGCFTGYNQEDGIVFNADSFQRGMFRNITYRSYETFEEDDKKANIQTRIGNPANIPAWTNLRAGVDYKKLDERGIIKKGEYADENTVLVGRYIRGQNGDMKDASLSAQVWTSGRVDEVSVTVNNFGLCLVKIRIVQDRTPELGDKFSNRHGQKGTIGMLIPAIDMPRTASGLVPDMMMNPHAIPSRMTIAQLLESILGKAACMNGFIGDATAFMNESGIEESIGNNLEERGFQRYGEELFYDGTTGGMIPSTIFVGNVYTMRLKHMVEDKWNARGEGRKEQRTHQPTGGRGNQGGLRIGEMDRDALIGHGITEFIRDTYLKRSDGTIMTICNGCGTIPIYNEKENFYFCSLCDGPAMFVGENASNLEILPSLKRSINSFSSIELPYAFEVLNKELTTYLNMHMRYLTAKDVRHIRKTGLRDLNEDVQRLLHEELVPRIIAEQEPPEEKPVEDITEEQLRLMGVEPDEANEMNKEPLINIETAKRSLEALVKAQNEELEEELPEMGIMGIEGITAADGEGIVDSPPSQLLPQQPYMVIPMGPAAATQIITPQIPNAPQTLVIDTAGDNMPRSILRRPNSPSRLRSRSPSQGRTAPSFSINKLGEGISEASSVPTNAKINIVKEG